LQYAGKKEIQLLKKDLVVACHGYSTSPNCKATT